MTFPDVSHMGLFLGNPTSTPTSSHTSVIRDTPWLETPPECASKMEHGVEIRRSAKVLY